jgi:hypothetical protein
MKKIILLLNIMTWGIFTYAQDSIYLVSNTVVAAKITYINTDDIEYKKPNNFDGPTYREKKSNILRVRYSNGDIEFYQEQEYFGAGGKSALAVERGEPATIVLLSEKAIRCEIMDISNLCVVYKEKAEDEYALVLMKSSIDRIWRKDSSYSTFAKDGQEYKHPKPLPKPAPIKEDPSPPVATETRKPVPEKAPEKTPDTKPKEEAAKTPPGDRKESKGSCQLITTDGDYIDGKNLQINYTKKTLTYIDQFGKIVTHTFQEIPVIKCPPNFISENLNEQ